MLATCAAVSHARLAVATPQRMFVERADAVGVGVDHDRHPGGCGGTGGLGRQVAAVGVAVDLEHRPAPGRRLEDGLEIHRVGGPAFDQATGGMGDHVHQRVFDRRDHALGHGLLADPEGGVDARHQPVEAPEQLVLVVERAVGQDVDLAAGQQLDPLHTLVGLRHELDLTLELFRRDVVSEPVAGGVVGDGEVVVAPFAGRGPHLLDRVVTVGGVGVAVEVAADVLQRDELRQRAVPSRLQLAPVLAQLGLDVGETHEPVHLLLAHACGALGGGVVEHAVLGQVQAPAHRQLAQGRVVAARAGEVLEQVPALLGCRDPQLHGDAGVRQPTRPRLARRAHALDLLELGQLRRELRRGRARRHQVEVLDAVGLPAHRTGDQHLRAAIRPLRERAHQLLRELGRAREDDPLGLPRGGRAAVVGERLQDAFLELRAEALDAPDALGERRLAQGRDGVNPELVVEQPRALGPEPGQPRELHQSGRKLRPQALGGGDRARFGEVDDLLLQRLADPLQLGGAPLAGEAGDRDGRFARRFRGPLIGHHAVHDRPVELVQIGQFLERRGDLGV